MTSLSVLAIATLSTFLLMSWALAWAAAAVGSSRGRFRWGLLVAAVLLVIGLAFTAVGRLMPEEPVAAATFLVITFFGTLSVAYLAIKFVFRLSLKRSFAPFAAYLATSTLNALITLLLVTYVCEAFRVPKGAMSPTIEPTDRVMADKLLSPRRWDLIVYQTENDEPQFYCKRLIGLPGETLRFENGDLYVDEHDAAPPAVLVGRLHASIPDPGPGEARYSDGETITLAADEYFVIGDNVAISRDSRYDGPSHGGAIVGVVDVLYWPLGRFHFFR